MVLSQQPVFLHLTELDWSTSGEPCNQLGRNPLLLYTIGALNPLFTLKL